MENIKTKLKRLKFWQIAILSTICYYLLTSYITLNVWCFTDNIKMLLTESNYTRAFFLMVIVVKFVFDKFAQLGIKDIKD